MQRDTSAAICIIPLQLDPMKAREMFLIIAVVICGGIAALYFVWPPVLWAFVIVGPLVLMGISDIMQSKQAIKRNYPLLGRLRYVLEAFRPEIQQYFVETDTEGRPINRLFRSLIYQRAKAVNDTTPFGTQLDVYKTGYEWMDHSIYAASHDEIQDCTRVTVGGPDCKLPYSASVLNISAMSFGSLSKNAVLAMNTGAQLGGFAQNTGEGGIAPHHTDPNGDLIWQVGTGYFGCRADDGNFDPEGFKSNATKPSVKMIEIKLSQGAKPGHGGILPASKNTPEIAKIRHVKPHIAVHSPPKHTAFQDPEGLMKFVKQCRDLSGGKPVGFKLCIGKKQEFKALCEAMISTGISPDFISIDGGEGGTGAAPVEFSNSLGMPMRDGLAFAYDTLVGYGLKKDIRIIASGKILSGFHMVRAIALGADICNSARAMMIATGCIQALQCNTNTCPVGVATQDKSLMKGLVVADKGQRVANFHEKTVESFVELIAAAGIMKLEDLNRIHINRRVSMHSVLRYDEIYPYVEEGSLVGGS
jgi:glutamate synthase domain-containing protein 2